MGSAPGTGSAQVGARQGGWCCRVLVAGDVHPLNVRALPCCAFVADVLLDQGAQCVVREVFNLRFVRRRSCAESMRSPAKWA